MKVPATVALAPAKPVALAIEADSIVNVPPVTAPMVDAPKSSTTPALTPPVSVAESLNWVAPVPLRLSTVAADRNVTDPLFNKLASLTTGSKFAVPCPATVTLFEVPIAVTTESVVPPFTLMAPLKPVCVPESVKSPFTLSAPAPASVPPKFPPETVRREPFCTTPPESTLMLVEPFTVRLPPETVCSVFPLPLRTSCPLSLTVPPVSEPFAVSTPPESVPKVVRLFTFTLPPETVPRFASTPKLVVPVPLSVVMVPLWVKVT